MTEKLIEAAWLLSSKDNLLRMREEMWLTDAEITIVERGIAALDSLLADAFAS